MHRRSKDQCPGPNDRKHFMRWWKFWPVGRRRKTRERQVLGTAMLWLQDNLPYCPFLDWDRAEPGLLIMGLEMDEFGRNGFAGCLRRQGW